MNKTGDRSQPVSVEIDDLKHIISILDERLTGVEHDEYFKAMYNNTFVMPRILNFVRKRLRDLDKPAFREQGNDFNENEELKVI